VDPGWKVAQNLRASSLYGQSLGVICIDVVEVGSTTLSPGTFCRNSPSV